MATMPSVIIAGASTGIRASYAERFQRCGHHIMLVASDEVTRMSQIPIQNGT